MYKQQISSHLLLKTCFQHLTHNGWWGPLVDTDFPCWIMYDCNLTCHMVCIYYIFGPITKSIVGHTIHHLTFPLVDSWWKLFFGTVVARWLEHAPRKLLEIFTTSSLLVTCSYWKWIKSKFYFIHFVLTICWIHSPCITAYTIVQPYVVVPLKVFECFKHNVKRFI